MPATASPSLQIAADVDPLLEAVSRGAHDAFAALHDLMLASIYAVAYRVVGNAALSEEITQEVLLAVWTQGWSFDRSRGSARAWILTIAHRRAVDVVRRESSSSARIDRVAAANADRPYDEVAEAVLDRSEHARVRVALGSLTALQRQAIDLAYYDGHTHREIADILDIPLGTAKTRLADGLRRLRRHLGSDQAARTRKNVEKVAAGGTGCDADRTTVGTQD